MSRAREWASARGPIETLLIRAIWIVGWVQAERQSLPFDNSGISAAAIVPRYPTIDVQRFAIVHIRGVGFEVLGRSEEHTSELQSLMRISYAVFCLKKTKIKKP